MSATIEFAASYVRTIWEAEDRSMMIVQVKDEGNNKHAAKGPMDAGPKLQEGLRYRFYGQWERHEKYGRQFSFGTFSAIEPHDRKGVIAYLVSLVEGVGEKKAAKLWDAFGPDAVKMLRTQPERVADLHIMNLDTAKEASESLQTEAAFESVKIDLLALFAGRGFQANKLIKECLRGWGSRAPERIRKNPYLLMFKKMPSAGFKRCDKLWLDLGLPAGKLKRQALCAWYAVSSDGSGHTWHEGQKIARGLTEAVPGANPLRALKLATRGRLLAKHKNEAGVWLAEAKKAHHEALIADKVREMTNGIDRATATEADGQAAFEAELCRESQGVPG